MGKLTEARPLYQQALGARRETLGDRHADTLGSIYSLASLLEQQGKLAEAIPLFVEELAACESLLCTKHEQTRDSATHLTKLLRHAGQHEKAKALTTKHGVRLQRRRRGFYWLWAPRNG